jgi:quercetin 2,3-dioxygenase
MLKNELPSVQAPYKLDAGEGMRYAFGNQLATRIATPGQLGQAASGTLLTGAKGSAFPLHRHQRTHEALYVMKGIIKLLLDGKSFLLTSGDYVNIPPGATHQYEFLDHHSQLLSWTFGGNAAEAYGVLGRDYLGTIYSEEDGPIDWSMLDSAVDTEMLDHGSVHPSSFAEKRSSTPQGMLPFVLAAGEGERMIAGDQLYTILGNQAHSNGTFIALLTEGPIGPAIPRHQHEKVTELFHCLNGQMEMFAGDTYVTLDAGDFLHVPPHTPHSFQLKKHDTRFLGFITPGHFEPFFRYLCEPFSGYRYPLVPHPFRFDRVIQHLAELDLTLLERPAGPPPDLATTAARN